MVRAYNRHGREAGRVVQVTCDVDMEAEFLRLMRIAGIRKLEDNVDHLALVPDNPATHEERTKQTIAHLETSAAQWQWRSGTDAAKFDDTRTHFTNFLPVVQQMLCSTTGSKLVKCILASRLSCCNRRLQPERREEEARRMREQEREHRRIAALQGDWERGREERVAREQKEREGRGRGPTMVRMMRSKRGTDRKK